MQEQVFELPVMAARTDPGQTINDQFNIVLLRLVDHSLEICVSSEHLARCCPAGHRQAGGICTLVLVLAFITERILGIALHRNVIPLEYAFQIQCSHTTLFIVSYSIFDGLEGPTLGESLVLEIDSRVLVINLHFMERVVAHALCMDDESTLCVEVVKLIVTHVVACRLHLVTSLSLHWESMGLWRFGELSSPELSLLIDYDKPPIIEATLPELTKVDLDLNRAILVGGYIARCNSVPSQHRLVCRAEWRWGR